MIIRDAEIKDIDRMLLLLKQLGYEQSKSIFTENFKFFTAKDEYHIFVAEIDMKAAGMIAISTSHYIIAKKIRIEIEALVVDEQYRRQGIASALIKHVENYAKRNAPAVIQLVSNVIRSSAHEFYRSLGYKNEGKNEKLYLRKDIDKPNQNY